MSAGLVQSFLFEVRCRASISKPGGILLRVNCEPPLHSVFQKVSDVIVLRRLSLVDPWLQVSAQENRWTNETNPVFSACILARYQKHANGFKLCLRYLCLRLVKVLWYWVSVCQASATQAAAPKQWGDSGSWGQSGSQQPWSGGIFGAQQSSFAADGAVLSAPVQACMHMQQITPYNGPPQRGWKWGFCLDVQWFWHFSFRIIKNDWKSDRNGPGIFQNIFQSHFGFGTTLKCQLFGLQNLFLNVPSPVLDLNLS